MEGRAALTALTGKHHWHHFCVPRAQWGLTKFIKVIQGQSAFGHATPFENDFLHQTQPDPL
jgi:hypothetical protein